MVKVKAKAKKKAKNEGKPTAKGKEGTMTMSKLIRKITLKLSSRQ